MQVVTPKRMGNVAKRKGAQRRMIVEKLNGDHANFTGIELENGVVRLFGLWIGVLRRQDPWLCGGWPVKSR